MKYLGLNLTKHVQDLYTGNKEFVEKTKKNHVSGDMCYFHESTSKYY